MTLGLFLQNTVFTDVNFADNNFLIAIAGLVLAFLVLFIIIAMIVYVYTSLAYFAIGKKARLKSPGLSWIPLIGPLIIAFQSSKMHWWPWLLLIGFGIPIIGFFACIIFAVFTVIWHWKLFESIKRPGWWAILMVVPILNLVILGVVAWGKK